MPRPIKRLLDVHLATSEGSFRLAGGVANAGLELGFGIDAPHALSAAAGGGLEQHGIAQLMRDGSGALEIAGWLLASGHHGSSRPLRQSPRPRLRSQLPDGIRRWADEHQFRRFARGREICVLAQEAVARMDGFSTGPARGVAK